ncbi:hypothetical protein R77592_04180 [Ralstonia mannitolilytica]|nr:hypothetical protein R77592_04180 [Ralstonia mannitolilytica]
MCHNTSDMTMAMSEPPIRIAPISNSPMPGNSTAAVRMTESITSTATTPPVKMFIARPFVQGPSTALSLHNSSRNTVALGSSTPASDCTALVNSPSGTPGVSTNPAASSVSPK